MEETKPSGTSKPLLVAVALLALAAGALITILLQKSLPHAEPVTPLAEEEEPAVSIEAGPRQIIQSRKAPSGQREDGDTPPSPTDEKGQTATPEISRALLTELLSTFKQAEATEELQAVLAGFDQLEKEHGRDALVNALQEFAVPESPLKWAALTILATYGNAPPASRLLKKDGEQRHEHLSPEPVGKPEASPDEEPRTRLPRKNRTDRPIETIEVSEEDLELAALHRVLASDGPEERRAALSALDEKVKVGMTKEQVLRLFPEGYLVEKRDSEGGFWLSLRGDLAQQILGPVARGLYGYFVRLDDEGRVRSHRIILGADF